MEFNAPLLKDVRLAKDVSLNAAARWTDYSTSGAIWTWKTGLVWKLGDQLTIRGTRSKDIRAPTLNDLYVPPSPATYGGQDFVTGVQNISPADAESLPRAIRTWCPRSAIPRLRASSTSRQRCRGSA